eukprot:COSAG04_NODE_17604_length_464_cov_0.928767_1_plen_80_part_10
MAALWRVARPFALSAGAGATVMVGALALDHATMSDMRRARGWSVESALRRSRNLAVRRIPAEFDTQFDLVELARHDGRDG